MTRDEVKAIIEDLVVKLEHDDNPPIERRADGPPPPEPDDWAAMEARFGCTFEDSFKHFMTSIVDYNCPTVLAVRRDGLPDGWHGWDGWRMDHAFDRETELGDWNPAMIPFFSLGNGDYYCLKDGGGGRSEVWFRDHEDESDEKIAGSFAEFLDRLEWHLNGTE